MLTEKMLHCTKIAGYEIKQDVMVTVLTKLGLFALVLVLVSACAPTSGNPYRQSSAYSALPYQSKAGVQMLSNGELHHRF